MARIQLNLPRTVRVVVPKNLRDQTPLAVQLIEQPHGAAGDDPEGGLGPTAAEQQLRQRLEQMEQEVLRLAKRVEQRLESLVEAEAARLNEYRQLAVRLGMVATRAVLREVTSENDRRLEQLIADGLAQVPGSQEIVVRLHPEQCDRLAYHFETAGLLRPIRFLADASIPCGEVQLDHPLFSLASNLAEQLEQLEQAFAEEVGS